jgi:HEAT repeat protein
MHFLSLMLLATQTTQTIAPSVDATRQIERALREAEVAVASMTDTRRSIETAMWEVQRELSRSESRMSRIGARSLLTTPPEPLQQADPADSIYRRARQALNRNDYYQSATLFQEIRSKYPRSAYVPDAYYWEAYSRYRRGGEESLRSALALLDQQQSKYPQAPTLRTGDARSLEARIQGELARRGDVKAAQVLAEQARLAAVAAPPSPPAAPGTPAPVAPPAPRTARGATVSSTGRQGEDACRDSDDDVQAAALNALMQMDSERALPILKKVLARRDEGSLCLRRRAVFMVSQHESAGTEEILLSAARSDPDPEVRSQAVFWLSQVNSPSAVAALDSIASASKDPEVQDKAIFALSQQESPEARRALRRYAERSDIPEELRGKAVFWLAQSDNPEDLAYLRGLYGKVQDPEVQERILFAIGQSDDAGSSQFLMEVARNQNAPIESRKKALFWMSQREETSAADIGALYGTFADREIKEQLIFALSQKDQKAATDKLIDIARREPDKELRKRAIFWLSQSDDPRVAEILAEFLEKP